MAEDLQFTYLDKEAKEIVKLFDSLEVVMTKDARKFRAKLCEELSKITHIRKEIENSKQYLSGGPFSEGIARASIDLLEAMLKPQYSCPHGDWFYDPCLDEDCANCKSFKEKYEFADLSNLDSSQVHQV